MKKDARHFALDAFPHHELKEGGSAYTIIACIVLTIFGVLPLLGYIASLIMEIY